MSRGGCPAARNLSSCLLLLVLLEHQPSAAHSPATPVFNPANGHWYQTVSTAPLTWQAAREAAAALSHGGLRGHLATITSADENRFIQTHVPGGDRLQEWWIGAYQDRGAPDYREPGSGWRWVTGEPFVFSDWALPPREPNNANGNEDVVVFRGPEGWNDLSHGDSRATFLVEYGSPAVPRTPRVGILPNPVEGGQATVGLLTVDRPASPGAVVVTLASGDPTVAAVPAAVVVPAGAESVLFSIVTFPVAKPTAVTLHVAGPGGSGPVTLQVLPAGTSLAAGNLLVNGSFEAPRATVGPLDTLTLRTPEALTGWRLTRGTVDVALAPSWEAAPGEGRQSLDLTGSPGAGAIEQSFPTVPGQEYLFTGWIAHHPDNPVAPEGRANVFLNGQFFVQLFHRDARATRGAMRWMRFSYPFRATATSTTLALVDATATWELGGIFLDGLAVTPARTNLLQNGNFEEPPIPAGHLHLILDPHGLPGWRVAPGGVVLVAPYRWQPAPGGGGQMLHLLNPLVSPAGVLGIIEQSFVTEPGRLYSVTGWLAHNPYRPEGRLQFALNGEPHGQLLHSNALFGPSSETEMRWQPFLFTFRATGAVTSLQIADVTGSPIAEGAVLDALTVTPAEAPIPGQTPAAPSGLAVRLISPTQIDLSWVDNSGEETALEIERREGGGLWTRIAILAANANRFSDFGVRPATTYLYRVRALNDAGSSAWSNEAGGMTLGGP